MSLSVAVESALTEAATALLHDQPLPEGVERVPSSALARVARMTVEGQEFYLKVYLSGGRMDNFKQRLRGNRAERARRAAEELEHFGFATAEVVLTGAAGDSSWMVSRAIDGIGFGFYAHGFLRPPFSPARLRWKREVITALGDYVGRLHAVGIVHGDLRMNNIIIDGHATEPSFALIDNERNMRFRFYMPRRLRIKNLVQVTLFYPPLVSRTDRLRFYQAYCKAIGLSSRRKRVALARATERKYEERYQRLKNKQRKPVDWAVPDNVSNVPD